MLRLNKKTIKISHQCFDTLKKLKIYSVIYSLVDCQWLIPLGIFVDKIPVIFFLLNNNKLDSLEVHEGNLMKLDKIAQLNNKIVSFDSVI